MTLASTPPISPFTSILPPAPFTHRLSKSRIISGLQCHKRLWLETHHRELMVYTPVTSAASAQGHAFGILARSLIEHAEQKTGLLIALADDPKQAVHSTAEALAHNDVLFEPAFRHQGVFIRADALLRTESGYTLIEVKASSGVKPQYLRDAAIQTWVMRGAGIHIDRIELAHVNTAFVYNEINYHGLLKRVDITAQVEALLQDVDAWVDTLNAVMACADMPNVDMGKHCSSPYPCPFISYCTETAPAKDIAPPEHSIFMLPGIKGKVLARKLQAQGYEDLLAVPFDLIAPYECVQTAHRTGHAWHDAVNAKNLLDAQPKPWAYLDFETISPAVPLWAGTRPFAHWPFQWSVHLEQADGHHTHHDFLDISGNNPSQACIKQMLAVLGNAATVWAYNAPFERQAIMRMANAFTEHAAELTALADKLQDLIPIVQACYYHPAMQGSYSIKAVLPAIAPELNYHDLEGVQDGNAAQAAFFEAIDTSTTPERKQEIDTQLRAYCQLDTWAMVVLVQRLLNPEHQPLQ